MAGKTMQQGVSISSRLDTGHEPALTMAPDGRKQISYRMAAMAAPEKGPTQKIHWSVKTPDTTAGPKDRAAGSSRASKV